MSNTNACPGCGRTDPEHNPFWCEVPPTKAEQAKRTELDAFTRAYIRGALWSSLDEATPQGGEPLDANYSSEDLAPEALARIREDCKRFQALHFALISSNLERAGVDFWLTRNGHGAGFRAGDWPEDSGETLTKTSHDFGEQNIYVGDDGKLYI